jgi:DNA-binding response OmpR family regulator
MPEESPQRKNVLVVEDDDTIRRLVRLALTRAGYSVEEARNGRDAKKFLAAQEFDAIVLDLMMPVESGFDVLDFMGERSISTSNVIILSAAGRGELMKVDPASVFSTLPKPFDVDELTAEVDDCIRLSRRPSVS